MRRMSGTFFDRVLPLGLIAVVVLGYSALLSLGNSFGHAEEGGGAVAESPSGYKPVAPLAVIMEHVDETFGELPAKIQKKQFKTIKKESLFVAELVNIAAHHDAKEEWKQIAVKTRDLLIEVSKASDQKDESRVKSLYDSTNESCESCHTKFRKD